MTGGGYPLKGKLHIGEISVFSRQMPEPGFLFSGEAHPMAELIYLESGCLHSVAEGRDVLLQAGDLALYGPNQWHMQYADIGESPRFVTVIFDLEGVDLSPLQNHRIPASEGAATLLNRMLSEWEARDDYFQDMILAQLRMLLMLLLRQEKNTRNSLSSEHQILCRAQQYVTGHVREKLSVPLVAGQVDVSPSYLTALFQKNLHISPGEYIRRVKLQESKQMIREGKWNFTEISEILQYSTVHHFSRQFKEKFGITPSEYAKSVK